MREAYKEIMDHVFVTEEMQGRILRTIHCTDFPAREREKVFLRPLHHYWVAACLAVLMIGTAGILYFLPAKDIPGKNPSGLENGISEFREVTSAEELSEAVGFAVAELSDLPFVVIDTTYMILGGEIAEIRYSGENQSAVFRQSRGESDPSGDFTVYGDIQTENWDNCQLTLKGEEGVYVLAVWSNENRSCSIKFSDPLPEKEWKIIWAGIV